MNLYLIPMDKFVKHNNLKEVSNPIYFERGNIPTKDGLFSTEIFGADIRSRKQTYAYIDLKSHFLQPQIYKLLKRLDRRFVNIVSGLGNYDIDKNGQIVDVAEGSKGYTGLGWLYKVWPSIKFKKNESYLRNEKIDLLESLPRDTIFCTKWVVIPPFTRDVNLQQMGSGKVNIHVLNDLYSKLIRNSKVIESESDFDFTLHRMRFQMQQTLEEIYNYFKSKLEGKHGLIRKQLLGKSTTNACISVITNPRVHTVKKVDEDYISLDRVGIPISVAAKSFFPFVIYEVKRFISNIFELSGNRLPVYRDSNPKEPTMYTFQEPMMFFNEEYLKKRIELFNNTPTSRFELVEVPALSPDGKEELIPLVFRGKYTEQSSTISTRHLTWMDVLYIACVKATKDKYVHCTRHPVLDKFGSFVAQPTILSTIDTVEVVVNDDVYDRYPLIKFDLSPSVLSTYFIDNVSFSNAYAPAMGADYDGDTIIVKAIWSQQANANAKRIVNSKNNLIAIDGNNTRILGKEVSQCLYNLTK